MYYHVIREITKNTYEIKLYSSHNSIFTSDLISSLTYSIDEDENKLKVLSGNFDNHDQYMIKIIQNIYPDMIFV